MHVCNESVDNSLANNILSPRNSNVVSDIARVVVFAPPNKATTLKFGPQSNTTPECPYRGVMATGTVTCMTMKIQHAYLLCVMYIYAMWSTHVKQPSPVRLVRF